tara:strand:+ start:689 stop:1018 length:330 start_codon:yes stop_codon:yes gene_type:complete
MRVLGVQMFGAVAIPIGVARTTESKMGIYGALSTAVTGMAAQSFALENISGNIANSQTTGYKRMETGFIDLIPDAAVGRQSPARFCPTRAPQTMCVATSSPHRPVPTSR